MREWRKKARRSACKGVYASNHRAYESPDQQSFSQYVRRLFLFTMKIENSKKFQFRKIVLCQQHIPPLQSLPISSFLIYLSIKDHVEYQRRSFLQQQKAANQGLFYLLTVPLSSNALFEKRNVLFSTKISKNTCNSGRV